ncbi:MAG: hypothetical protein KatS3mg028_1207 [Bacteroidia bacterium]|nr:MAG: hypothetical protein KatS3mg028_1207 [Bacteroidia bacterium]
MKTLNSSCPTLHVVSDIKKFKQLNIEYNQLKEIVEKYEEYKKALRAPAKRQRPACNTEKDREILELAKHRNKRRRMKAN